MNSINNSKRVDICCEPFFEAKQKSNEMDLLVNVSILQGNEAPLHTLLYFDNYLQRPWVQVYVGVQIKLEKQEKIFGL